MSAVDLFEVATHERETVRVFAVDLQEKAAKAWLGVHSNIETALGSDLDPDHVEYFPAEDLKGLGLAQFLIDGHGIAEADVADDRDLLDEAGPALLLVRARAFRGAAVSLNPKAPLVPIGAYGQAPAEPSGPTPARPMDPAEQSQAAPDAGKAPRGSLTPVLIFLGLALVLFAVLLIPKL